MTDRKTRVQQFLALKALADIFQAELGRRRTELADHFTDPGEREVGTLNDQRLGTVSLVKGAESWAVVDEQAFTDWVVRYYGDRALVKSVDPIIRDMVLAACKQAGGMLMDEVTGEIAIPPGVQQKVGAPYVYAKTEKHAGWLIWQELGGSLDRLGIEAPK